MLRGNPTLRFKMLVGAVLLVLAIGNGTTLSIIQRNAHRRCVEALQRSKATAPALAALVEAHRKDGDKYAEQTWQRFLEAAKKNPVPKC